MSQVHPRCRVGPCLRPNDATALLHLHYRGFNAHIGSPAADGRFDIPPRGMATCRFSTHHPSTFTCSAGEPELRSCRLYTGCRWVDLQISLPAHPAGTLHPAVLTASSIFGASSVGSPAFTFSALTFRSLGTDFSTVAHYRGLATTAALPDLKPASARRLRGANPHLLYSIGKPILQIPIHVAPACSPSAI